MHNVRITYIVNTKEYHHFIFFYFFDFVIFFLQNYCNKWIKKWCKFPERKIFKLFNNYGVIKKLKKNNYYIYGVP